MSVLAVIVTIAAGVFGGAIGGSQNSDWGMIVAIAVMGGFILSEIRKRGKE